MSKFPVHDETTAPQAAVPRFAQIKERMGFVPNVLRTLAEEPAALDAYLDIDRRLDESAFTPAEKQVALLTVSRVNRCDYCVAAHSAGAKKAGLDEASIQALRGGEPLPDEKLEALRVFTEHMVRERGFVSEDVLGAFLDAGYSTRHVLAVVMAISLKTLSNYTNHMAATPLDEPLRPLAWTPEPAGA